MSRLFNALATLARGLANLPALLRLGLEALDAEVDGADSLELPEFSSKPIYEAKSVPTYSLKSATPSFQSPLSREAGYSVSSYAGLSAARYPGQAEYTVRDESYEKAVDAVYLRLERDSRLVAQVMGEEA